LTSVADSVELVKATGCPSCSRAPPRPGSLASTCNTHGLFTSKNFSVVAFSVKLLAVLKALSCWEDYDHTASPSVYCGSSTSAALWLCLSAPSGPGFSDTGCRICLFTCGSTRVIHTLGSLSLTTQAFIRYLRRFVARRGIPEVIISDSAKTFKAPLMSLCFFWKGKFSGSLILRRPYGGGDFLNV